MSRRIGKNRLRRLNQQVTALQAEIDKLRGPWLRATNQTDIEPMFIGIRSIQTEETESFREGLRKEISIDCLIGDMAGMREVLHSHAPVAFRGYVYGVKEFQMSMDGDRYSMHAPQGVLSLIAVGYGHTKRGGF